MPEPKLFRAADLRDLFDDGRVRDELRNGVLASQMFTICQTGVADKPLRLEIETG